jgi:hypothetical protein
MSNASRLKPIKNIGLCTILVATENMFDELSFFPSQLNVQNKRQSPLSEANDSAEILIIAVGNKGLKVAKALQFKTKPIDVLTGKPVIIQHFSPNNNQIDGLISEVVHVLLVGSMKDRDFWTARKLIACHDLSMSCTIAIEDGNPILAVQNFPANEQEVCVIIPEKHYVHQSVLILHSLLSMFLMPSITGLDFSDVKSIVSRKSGVMLHAVSSYEKSISAFKQTIDPYKAHIKNSKGLLLNIMYGEDTEFTLTHLTDIVDETYNCCHSKETLVWTCTPNLKLDADFRATLFISMNDNLIDDLSQSKGDKCR